MIKIFSLFFIPLVAVLYLFILFHTITPMHTLNFSTTINAPVAKVRDTMLNHPSYEIWTSAFSEGSTYTGSWDQWADIKFVDPSGQGMIAQIAESRLHEYVSIRHLWEMMNNPETGELVTRLYDHAWYENYSFSTTDTATRLDIEMTAIPDEYVDMFNSMRPKALDLLKELCETD